MFTLQSFLEREVRPALGCTEPGAVALAVARAVRELPSDVTVQRVVVRVSDSVYKNGMAVGIPGAGGAKGNAMAAALAVLRGNSDYGLEVLKDCRPEDVVSAGRCLRDGRITVECLPEVHGVYVEAQVFGTDHQATCRIAGTHSNVAQVTRNGQVTFSQHGADDSAERTSDILDEIRGLTFAQLLEYVEHLDEASVEYIWHGVELNRAVAEYGLSTENDCGLNSGRTLASLVRRGVMADDLVHRIRVYCSAASDARMAGVPMPVMSSGGSGNHGITAILPVALTGEALGKSRREVAKAIVVSHLVTSMVKSKTGRLVPVCGCTAAAGAGAAAGLTYLQGGTREQVAKAAQTLLASTAGLVCDGAKESCALKVGTAAAEAYLASLISLSGAGVASPQGVVGGTVEETTDNIGRLNREGLDHVDQVIIDILRAHAAAPPE